MIKNLAVIFSVALIYSTLIISCKQTNKTEPDKTNINKYIGVDKKTIYPIEVISYDSNGKPVTQVFEKAPSRIITTNLSAIETLLELGLGNKIIGTTKPDNEVDGKWKFAVNKLEQIGDKMTTSKEIIVGKSPDIIIGSAKGLTDQYLGSLSSYNAMGIKVYTQSASIIQNNPKLTTIIDDVRILGLIFDVNVAAENYAMQLEQIYNGVIDKVSKKKTSNRLSLLPMVAFDSEKKSYSSFTVSEGLQLDILNTLNIKPGIDGASLNNNYENLIGINPDIILYIKADRHKKLDDVAIDFIKKDALLKHVSAVDNNRIYTVTYDNFMDYGARNFATLLQLYESIYGK